MCFYSRLSHLLAYAPKCQRVFASSTAVHLVSHGFCSSLEPVVEHKGFLDSTVCGTYWFVKLNLKSTARGQRSGCSLLCSSIMTAMSSFKLARRRCSRHCPYTMPESNKSSYSSQSRWNMTHSAISDPMRSSNSPTKTLRATKSPQAREGSDLDPAERHSKVRHALKPSER